MIRRILDALRGPATPPPAPQPPALTPYLATLHSVCGCACEVPISAASIGEAMNALAYHVHAPLVALPALGWHRGQVVHHGFLYPCDSEALRFTLHEWIDEDAPLPCDLPEGVTLSSAA